MYVYTKLTVNRYLYLFRYLFGDLPRSPHGLCGGLWRSMNSTGSWSSDAHVFSSTNGVVGFRAKKSLVLHR